MGEVRRVASTPMEEGRVEATPVGSAGWKIVGQTACAEEILARNRNVVPKVNQLKRPHHT